MSIRTIRPEELQKIVQGGNSVELIDVRTPAEYREVHATFARNIPLETVDPKAIMQARNGNAEKTLYVICHAGSRGGQACQKFISEGFTNVVNVDGGTRAWDAAGLDVVRGKKAISLERQVRIVAGTLVVTGAVFGYFINPFLIGLSAMVGAGLIFAGVTDSCGMAIILTRMPWNQVNERNLVCSERQ